VRVPFDAGIVKRSRLEQFLQERFKTLGDRASQTQVHSDEWDYYDWLRFGARVECEGFAATI
jgi:hypothetical protein